MKTVTNLVMLIVFVFGQLQPNAAVVNAKKPTQTPAATATATEIITEAPTASATETLPAEATVTESAPEATATELVVTETPEPASETATPEVLTSATPESMSTFPPTGTMPPTGTVTPTATAPVPATVSASATPGATETPEIETPGSDEITLKAVPEFILPGGEATIHWLTKKPTAGYDLVFFLPQGVAVQDKEKDGVYDPATNTYRLPATAKGKFRISVSEAAEAPVYIDARLVSNATEALRLNAEALVTDDLAAAGKGALALVEKANVDKQGGEALGLKGKIKVKFPEGTLPESAEVFIHKPLRESMPKYSLSGQPFEINARGTNSKTKLDKFAQEVEIELSYAERGFSDAQAGDVHIYYYKPETQTWEAIATTFDPQTKTVHGYTKHFTVYDIGLNNWQASKMPTIDAFQVANFTGAATFNYPIVVPPGPGGLQPSLSLSYNSQVIDQSFGGQASWVGLGWSLDVGSIEKNTHGTSTYPGDDSYYLNLNGISSPIIQQPDGSYHLADENFMRLGFDGNETWTLWDKEGNVYTFKVALNYYEYLSGCAAPHNWNAISIPYRWVLMQVRNKVGQTINYSYEYEVKNMRLNYKEDYCSERDYSVKTAAYLKTIRYANDRYQVRFERQNRDSMEYYGHPIGEYAYESFERTRLQWIVVEKDDNRDGVFEPVRTYQLTQTANQLWYLYVVNMLTAITEYGSDGTAFPASYTFVYGDNQHLSEATNGYGGG